ncbi:MAG: ZIP family metal transporter [Nitrososphaeraceae archaeon]
MENKLFETISAFFTAFGAGMLMSAAIFEMIIEANRVLGIIITFITFIAGAVIFTIADIIAERKGGGAGILLGIGLDAIPESITFGVLIGSGSAYALAILIGIQNIPEGIASFKEMTTGRRLTLKKALVAIGIVSVIPLFMGLLGYFYLQEMINIISIILAISAGGIFYMLYYDMIPKTREEKNWFPTFGSVFGFIIGFAIVVTLGN